MRPYQRIFAREFNAATLKVEDAEGPGGYSLITPGGAICGQLYLSGALLEVGGKPGDVMYARLADPTGAFSLVVPRYETEAADAISGMKPPCFATVVGEARMAGSGDRSVCTVAVGDARGVERRVRDLWVVRTAALTCRRIQAMASALSSGTGPESLLQAIRHYGTGRASLQELARMAQESLKSVDLQITPPAPGPDPVQVVLGIVEEHGGKKGIPVGEIISIAAGSGISAEQARQAVETLLREDECYQPQKGVIRRL